MIKRSLQEFLLEDLARYDKMLFVSGPRQSGKTTMARMILEEISPGRYWNYDVPEDQLLLLKNPAFYEEIDREAGSAPLVVFDEVHKYPDWKNYLKGAFDRSHGEFRFLVTGSGRLDLYQRGGDSLAGRYLLWHLFPLTIGEVNGQRVGLEDFLVSPDRLPEAGDDGWETWRALEELSGFPEPFLRGEESFYRRWSGTYRRQVIREDIRDLTQVRKSGQMEILASLLPGKVGGLLSVNSLREDLKVSFETVKSWIGIFEDFLYVFLVPPWSRKVPRAVRKEPKLYLYDWVAVADEAARFENMVALHLLQAVTGWTERGQGEFGLHFIRDRQKNEVDFLISREGEPFLLVECKLADTEPSPVMVRMKKRLGARGAVQLVNRRGVSRRVTRDGETVLVVSADRWLRALPF